MSGPRAGGSALRLCAALAVPVLLGGCAAAAIPVVAGAVIAKEGAGGGVKETPPDPRYPRLDALAKLPPAPPPAVAAAPTAPPASLAAAPSPTALPVKAAPSVALAAPAPVPPPPTMLKALPPPSGAPADGGYLSFTSHALAKVEAAPAGRKRKSVILDEDSRLPNVALRDCGSLAPAVIVDLDPGKDAFDPATAGDAEPGLSEALAALRAAGITVLWASSLPVSEAQAVYDRLRATNLDPDGIDRLLLLRAEDERKQTRRAAAARDWCVIAMAGDQRSDFDEMFDYLRDESFAAPLEFLSGDGWFIAPRPIQTAQAPIQALSTEKRKP